MIQVYYVLSYADYKKHAAQLPSCVGHSADDPLTDTSEIVLKVIGEDHMHFYLEQHGILSLPKDHVKVQKAATAQPLLKVRG